MTLYIVVIFIIVIIIITIAIIVTSIAVNIFIILIVIVHKGSLNEGCQPKDGTSYMCSYMQVDTKHIHTQKYTHTIELFRGKVNAPTALNLWLFQFVLTILLVLQSASSNKTGNN